MLLVSGSSERYKLLSECCRLRYLQTVFNIKNTHTINEACNEIKILMNCFSEVNLLPFLF